MNANFKSVILKPVFDLGNCVNIHATSKQLEYTAGIILPKNNEGNFYTEAHVSVNKGPMTFACQGMKTKG